MADVVSADGRAGAIHHVVVKGEEDVGSCQETKRDTMRIVTGDALATSPQDS